MFQAEGRAWETSNIAKQLLSYLLSGTWDYKYFFTQEASCVAVMSRFTLKEVSSYTNWTVLTAEFGQTLAQKVGRAQRSVRTEINGRLLRREASCDRTWGMSRTWHMREGHVPGAIVGIFGEGATWSSLPIEYLLCVKPYWRNHERRKRSRKRYHVFMKLRVMLAFEVLSSS